MDPIADMFSQIRNAQEAGKDSLYVPFSKVKMAILEILKNNHYIKSYGQIDASKKIPVKMEEIEKTNRATTPKKKHKALLEIVLDKNHLTHYKIQRVSKPGRRVYAQSNKLPKARSPQGIVIVSTSEGLMVGEDARKKSLGGEVMAEII